MIGERRTFVLPSTLATSTSARSRGAERIDATGGSRPSDAARSAEVMTDPSSRVAAALRIAVKIARVVGVLMVVISIFAGVGGGGGGRMHRAADEDPKVREAHAQDMRELWRGLTGRTARRIYRLAAGPVLLVSLAAWITAEHGLWTGTAFVGAIALAVFVYLLATPGTSEAASKAESAAAPTRDAERLPGSPDVHALPLSADPRAPRDVASPHLP